VPTATASLILRRPSWLLALAAALTALALVSSAQASSRTVRDPKGDPKGSDYPGPAFVWGGNSGPCAKQWVSVATGACGEGDYGEDRSALLDIASVSHGHRGSLLVHRLTTYRRWRLGVLSLGGQISFYFNLDADPALERRLDLAVSRGKPYGVIRNTRNGRLVGRARASRPSRRAIELTFPRARLGRSYRWFAFAGIGCRRRYDACGDRSPGASLIRHAS
jgi:hypothetical protein